MNIHECERLAQKTGKKHFTMKMKGRTVKAEWLDAFMGLVKVGTASGFVMTQDLSDSFPDLECEDLK
jgi:hypothetical protein